MVARLWSHVNTMLHYISPVVQNLICLISQLNKLYFLYTIKMFLQFLLKRVNHSFINENEAQFFSFLNVNLIMMYLLYGFNLG